MTSEAAAAVAAGEATHEQTVADQFLTQVRTRPDAPALYWRAGDRWQPITWGQFGQGARRLVSFLIAEGAGVGEHAAIWSNNRPEWHIADAAILCARVVPVPVYLTLSADQGQYVLGHSESRVVFVENRDLMERVLSVRDQLPRLARIVVIEGLDRESEDGFCIPWATALGRGQAAMAGHDAEIRARETSVSMDDTVTLIYTSGTTGPPKAVMLTNRNIAFADNAVSQIAHAGADDRMLSYLPLAHIAERLVSEFKSYRFGNPTYFLDGLPNLGERLRDVKPTYFFGVPRVWEKMAAQITKQADAAPQPRRAIARWALKTARRVTEVREKGGEPGALLARQHRLAEKLVLGKLRDAVGLAESKIIASGAAPLDPEVARFFLSIGLPICEVYGQSENTAITSMHRPGDVRVGTVGPPFPGVEVRIADDGEILVRSDAVMPGYYKDDAATHETIDADGWLHTGDVGEFNDEGHLRITDRKKDLIITAGGKNISPGNIQTALAGNLLVGNAIAIGDKRPYMTALLTLDPEEAPRWASAHGLPEDLDKLAESAELRSEMQRHIDAVNARLSKVEQIKKWSVLAHDFSIGDELTPTLKVKRKVVTEKYADVIEAMYKG